MLEASAESPVRRARSARALRRVPLFLIVALALAAPLLAQERTVRGRVLRPDERGLHGVSGAWVVLHRVGADTAAPLDSVRSGARGDFAFRYGATGDPNALYFVSASYAGIAYFGAPLRARDVGGADAEIIVHDTTSAPVPLHVRGRHLVIGAPRADGSRDIVEVFEISNDSSVTRIAADGGPPTWSTILPAGAAEFQVGQGDIAPQTVRLEGGRVVVLAPFAPGLKQLSFAYRLPASSFPASYPVGDGATVLEVLLEEPAAAASGAALQRVDPVSVEGRSFTRFLAQDVAANGVVRITVPAVASARERTRWMTIVGGGVGVVMLVALALAIARRRPAAVAAPSPSLGETPDTLARTIAALDDDFSRVDHPDAARRAAYERERASLKARLARALAATTPPS
jgi:hypothetical protein